MSGKYLGLIVRKDEIASKLMEAFSKGSQPDVLTLVCEAKLFDTVIQPTEKDGLDALNDVLASLSAPGPPPRPMAMGDFLITPTGQVKVVVGPGDFNDVTEKVAPLLGRYIPTATPPVVQANEPPPVQSEDEYGANPDEDDGLEEAEDEECDCPGCQAEKKVPEGLSAYFQMEPIANPRNIERREMQPLVKKAVLDAFQKEGIPLSGQHVRRATRTFLRLGCRLALETGADPATMLKLFFECLSKEGAESGKKVAAQTLAVIRLGNGEVEEE